MKDTIYRDDAIKGAKELYQMGDCYCDEYGMVGMLNSLPSAQPEIVRCKDCLYGLKGIPYRCRLAHDTDSENWYCADAKKREI